MLTCLRHANVSVAWKKSEAPAAVPKRFPLAITAVQVARTVTKTPLAVTVGRASGAAVTVALLSEDDVELYKAARAENLKDIEKLEKRRAEWDDKCETVLGFLGTACKGYVHAENIFDEACDQSPVDVHALIASLKEHVFC